MTPQICLQYNWTVAASNPIFFSSCLCIVFSHVKIAYVSQVVAIGSTIFWPLSWVPQLNED